VTARASNQFECAACRGPRRGIYRMTCADCCITLLREAPAGGPRRAMAAHLAASCDGPVWAEVMERAASEGLTR
jgi:hypothetical protein